MEILERELRGIGLTHSTPASDSPVRVRTQKQVGPLQPSTLDQSPTRTMTQLRISSCFEMWQNRRRQPYLLANPTSRKWLAQGQWTRSTNTFHDRQLQNSIRQRRSR